MIKKLHVNFTASIVMLLFLATANVFSVETIKEPLDKKKEVSSPDFKGFFWTDEFEKSEAGKKYLVDKNGKKEINPQLINEFLNLPNMTFLSFKLNKQAAQKSRNTEFPFYFWNINLNTSSINYSKLFTFNKSDEKTYNNLYGVLSDNPKGYTLIGDTDDSRTSKITIYPYTDGSKQVWEFSPGSNPELGNVLTYVGGGFIIIGASSLLASFVSALTEASSSSSPLNYNFGSIWFIGGISSAALGGVLVGVSVAMTPKFVMVSKQF